MTETLTITLPIKCSTAKKICTHGGKFLASIAIGIFLALWTFVAGVAFTVPMYFAAMVISNYNGIPEDVVSFVLAIALFQFICTYVTWCMIVAITEHYHVEVDITCIKDNGEKS